MIEPVVKVVEVSCTAARAFEVFATKTTTWWPKDKHAVSAGKGEVAKDVIIEPHLGGSVYEITPAGDRIGWGKVTRYEPGVALALMWNPGGGAAADTLVEVTFEMLPNGCRVTLTHSGWEALGESAGPMRDGYNSGWVHVFEEQYASACQKS